MVGALEPAERDALSIESQSGGRGHLYPIEILRRSAMAIAACIQVQSKGGGRNGGIGHLLKECGLFPRGYDADVRHVVQFAVELDQIART